MSDRNGRFYSKSVSKVNPIAGPLDGRVRPRDVDACVNNA